MLNKLNTAFTLYLLCNFVSQQLLILRQCNSNFADTASHLIAPHQTPLADYNQDILNNKTNEYIFIT